MQCGNLLVQGTGVACGPLCTPTPPGCEAVPGDVGIPTGDTPPGVRGKGNGKGVPTGVWPAPGKSGK